MPTSSHRPHRPRWTGRRSLASIAGGAAVSIAALGLSACAGGAGSTTSGSSSATLTVAISNLDGLSPQNNCTSPVITLAYEPLINVAPNGGYRPGLATSWSYSDDNKTFTLNLRSGAEFADGTPVTAQAVVNSLKWYQSHPGLIADYMRPITSMTAVNSTTVRLTEATPFSGMETLLSNNGECNNGHIVSAAGLADPGKLGTQTFGAGPYEVDTSASVPGSEYTLVPNPHYFDKSLQHWKKVVFKIIPDSNTAFDALLTGQVQIDTVSAPNLVSQAKAHGLTVTTGALAGPGVMLWDLNGQAVPALKDVRVRQALAYSVDRSAIAKAIGPTATPLDQFALAGTPGYDANLPDRYSYNVAKAKQLMAEAGYAKGFSMTLVTMTSSDPVGVTVAQAVVPYFAAIGVKVTVKPLPDASFFTDIAAKQYPGGAFSYALNGDVAFDALRLYEQPYSDTWNVFQTNPPTLAKAYQALASAPLSAYDTASTAFNAAATQQVLVIPVVQTYQFVFSKGIAIGITSPNGGFDYASWAPSD